MITEVSIQQVNGLLLGLVYDKEEIDFSYTEHTIQILFFIFSFNFIWVTEN